MKKTLKSNAGKIFNMSVDTLSISHILGHMKGKAERL